MADTLGKLTSFLRPLCSSGVSLAFSGGVDSSLLLALLMKMRQEEDFPLLVLSVLSPLQSDEDVEAVKSVAAACKAEVEFLFCDVLGLPEVKNNHPERCYFCKKALFKAMFARSAEQGISTLLEGTHADDLSAYRPGRKALAELGVISPFARLGISKEEIRRLAARLDVKTAERPSTPCLATRFDYGTELTAEKLKTAGEGEKILRSFLPPQADLRLRIHGTLGRIEVSEEAFECLLHRRREAVEQLKALGLEKVTLDLAGFASGSFDTHLKGKENV